MIKKILTLLLVINLNSCGYSPMFKYEKDINFKITKILRLYDYDQGATLQVGVPGACGSRLWCVNCNV